MRNGYDKLVGKPEKKRRRCRWVDIRMDKERGRVWT
jgi:hypothetical protein